MRALLIVDMLNDFGPAGALEVAGAAEIVEPINELQRVGQYDVIVLIQDFHPANHGSFASNNEGVGVGDIFDLNGLPQVGWPDHCVQGSAGCDFLPGLETQHAGLVIRKGMDPEVDSYSAFYDNGQRNSTGLTGYLKGLDIGSVDVVGLATDYCVKFTALDAVSEGFQTRLLTNCIRAVNLKPGDGDAAIEEMQTAGVEVL